MIKWNDYTIKKVEMTKEQRSELYNRGCNSHGMSDAPEVIANLEQGSYLIEETGQFFEVENYVIKEYKIHVHNLDFGIGKENVLKDYLNKVSERKEEEQLGDVLSEIIVFNNDLHTELVFADDVATMKPYYNKQITVKRVLEKYSLPVWSESFVPKVIGHEEMESFAYTLFLGDKNEIEIFYNEEMKKYSAYDGIDGYGWYDTIKEAVKSYMDSEYRYNTDEEYYESNCSNCRDGGCLYCEPHRFL